MSTSFHRGELPHNGKPVYFVQRKINGVVYLIGQITWIGDGWEFRNDVTGRRFDFDTLAEAKDEAQRS
jgi:hypothetical protein